MVCNEAFRFTYRSCLTSRHRRRKLFNPKIQPRMQLKTVFSFHPIRDALPLGEPVLVPSPSALSIGFSSLTAQTTGNYCILGSIGQHPLQPTLDVWILPPARIKWRCCPFRPVAPIQQPDRPSFPPIAIREITDGTSQTLLISRFAAPTAVRLDLSMPCAVWIPASGPYQISTLLFRQPACPSAAGWSLPVIPRQYAGRLC